MKSPYQPEETSSMRYPMILIVLSGGLLAGCTPFLEDLNANLKSVNDNLRKVNYSWRNTPGGSQTVTAEAEDEVCDPQAFQAGFSDEYVTAWNQEVGNREITYRFLSQSHPNDEAARHNYELYRGKTLSTKGIGNDMEYDLKIDNHGHIRNDCQARSYTQGGRAGIRAVARDLKTLSEQEIERRYN